MEVSKLYLFAKDTTAVAAQRGYNFQTLKTLESWVKNFMDQNKEIIYCEYEEDIFHKDILNKKAAFRQVKLYSSNFSFSNEEIKKSIFNFFMLHVKSDYLDFTKEFIFETNSGIAKKYSGNDAGLLQQWYDNQDNLNQELVEEIAQKVKGIIGNVIAQEQDKDETASMAHSAVIVYNSLEDSYWENFVKMIRWEFANSTPEEEYGKIRLQIEDYLLKLPFDAIHDSLHQTFAVLLECVFTRVTGQGQEQRCLTFELLEQTLLNIGSEEDKWYSRRYDYYRQSDTVTVFRMGEFFEVLDLVNYCRRKKYLHAHKALWNPYLIFYARLESLDRTFRCQAIYEIVFLNNEFYEVDYEKLDQRIRPEGSLKGFEQDLRFYFDDFSVFQNADMLAKSDNLINILFVAIGDKRLDIDFIELRRWFVSLYRRLHQKIRDESEINELCNLLELKGMILLGINRLRRNSNTEFLVYFEEILQLADKATLFKFSQFGERIEKFIKMQVNIDPLDEMGIIEALEQFSEALFPLVAKREGNIALAKSQVMRGYSYLKTSEPRNLLKALNYFHKAKDNYLSEDTIEGFVLALLNIAQLYNSIGMHFAAKNYSLGAFRVSTNEQLIKKIETSLAMLFFSDYKQGSWFNAMSTYGKYISLRLDSNLDKTDVEEEGRSTQRISFILYVMQRHSNQFRYLINNYLQYLDYVGEEIILPIQARIALELKSEESYRIAIEKNIDDIPLNDIGKERKISFYALGSLWNICFPNNYETLSPAEEFIATMQVMLAEIALSPIDFHLIKSQIEVEVEVSSTYKPPEQLPSNDVILWKVYVCYIESKDKVKLTQHAVFNTVSLQYMLNTISLLPEEEFNDLFWNFFKQSGIDGKQIAVNLYQRIHRDVYSEADFSALNAAAFNKENFILSLPRENKVMRWKSDLSAKYDRDFAIGAIKNRFDNTYKNIYLTLEALLGDPGFPKLINSLRQEGWKDWQIITNMQSFMINYKMQLFEDIRAQSEQEYIEKFKIAYYKYVELDEQDCFVQFPLEAFASKEFNDRFWTSMASILQTYGLQNKRMTPVFKDIKEFLDVRFNMASDDYLENNPLRGIAKLY